MYLQISALKSQYNSGSCSSDSSGSSNNDYSSNGFNDSTDTDYNDKKKGKIKIFALLDQEKIQF